ncbi:MAG: type II toxin-antitoxin system YafQ family toxin [Ruminiclostridium sp.]|nr:type II toxin-antitoxin system YafQ family toxin [Ruminiclostridium sp.]
MQNKYTVKFTSRFKKDYKSIQKRGLDTGKIFDVIDLIASGTNEERLKKEYDDHALSGNWKSYRECHIEPDWLLVYQLFEDVLVLSLVRTGTHSDLFGR